MTFIVNFLDGTEYSPQEWIKRYNMLHPLKIRASKAGLLMTDPKSAKDKAEGNLSEGAKTYIRELWIAKTYNRRKDFVNKYIEKGLLNEEVSIDYVSMLDNELYTKNELLFSNSHLIGTPDILTDTHVVDVKSSYDIFTFMKADLIDIYYYQLLSYMELTGLKQGRLIYCLTDAPEATIQRELKTAKWQLQTDNVSELEEKLRREMCYQDIPLKDKVKVFEVEYNGEEISRLYKKIEKCREYYGTLSLTPKQLQTT